MAHDKKFFIDLDKTPKERFDMGRFMEFSDNYDPLTSSMINDLDTVKSRSVYEVQNAEGRPDLISYRRYGDTQFWWVIALYLNKMDFDDFSVGEVLQTPEIDFLEDFYFRLKAEETISQ